MNKAVLILCNQGTAPTKIIVILLVFKYCDWLILRREYNHCIGPKLVFISLRYC